MDAVRSADLIVIGPGSLYTSLLPPLLVPGIRAALESAGAPRVFVCNVATQVGETRTYALSDHLAAFARHDLAGLVDAVLANDNYAARVPDELSGCAGPPRRQPPAPGSTADRAA